MGADAWDNTIGGAAYEFNGYEGDPGSSEQAAYGQRGPITEPMLWGGHMLSNYNGTALIHSRYHNGSCLLLWMSDHFTDGWDTAVLTVRAPDTTNNTFHP